MSLYRAVSGEWWGCPSNPVWSGLWNKEEEKKKKKEILNSLSGSLTLKGWRVREKEVEETENQRR